MKREPSIHLSFDLSVHPSFDQLDEQMDGRMGACIVRLSSINPSFHSFICPSICQEGESECGERGRTEGLGSARRNERAMGG